MDISVLSLNMCPYNDCQPRPASEVTSLPSKILSMPKNVASLFHTRLDKEIALQHKEHRCNRTKALCRSSVDEFLKILLYFRARDIRGFSIAKLGRNLAKSRFEGLKIWIM